MLRGIRKASENWLGRTLMGVVMTLLAGSFAVWGINDIFRGFGNSTLAKIGGVEIPIEQFRQSYQDRLEQISRQLGHPLPPDQASALGLDRQVLGELIAQAGLDQRAHQMGLSLADSEIAASIAADPNLQTVNGQFDRTRFDDVLRSMGLTEQRFVADQRQTALRRQIIDSVSGGIVPPKAWFDAINQYRNEQRSVEFVALGAAQAGDIPQPTDDQLEKYFEARKTLFRAPEYRKIDAVTATPAELAKWTEISDDDLKQAYDARRASFTTPERRHIEQIVFPAMADAQAAADRIKSGTSFAAIAAERGLKDQDIDLGTVAKSAIVDPAVADAAFSLKQGEVSAAMQGRFGAVLVTVLAIDPEVTKSLADVTPQLRNDLAFERAKPQVQDIHDKIEDDRAGGMTLEQAAAKEKLAMVTYDAVSRNGLDPDGKPVVNLPHGAEVINAAFASDVGVDNDPIDADGGYVWFDVAGVTPAHDRSLDEVKPQVEQQWRANETASRLRSKANDLLDKLKTGTPFDTLAASNGLKFETANDFNRRGAVAGMSPKTIDAVFHTAKDAFGSGEGNDPTQWVVFRVTGVKTPALDPNSAEAKDLQQTVQRQLGDDVIGQYVARLENDLGTNVNAAVLAQAMGQNNAPDTN
jgi:peptidyl-prolyl cis-trans isomerase D